MLEKKKVGKEDKVEMVAHNGVFSSASGSRRINIQRVLGAQLGRERVRGEEVRAPSAGAAWPVFLMAPELLFTSPMVQEEVTGAGDTAHFTIKEA